MTRLKKEIFNAKTQGRKGFHFISQIFKGAGNISKNDTAKKRLKKEDVQAFVRSLFYLGVLGNGVSQWYFWKMLFKSATCYRKSFAEAMTLMVYGYHFRKVAKKV